MGAYSTVARDSQRHRVPRDGETERETDEEKRKYQINSRPNCCTVNDDGDDEDGS